jgi:transcriptional regulator with XRE-family HTH domain
LAQIAQVSVMTVSRLERGSRKGSPEAETLRRVAEALQTTPDALFPELLSSRSAA